MDSRGRGGGAAAKHRRPSVLNYRSEMRQIVSRTAHQMPKSTRQKLWVRTHDPRVIDHRPWIIFFVLFAACPRKTDTVRLSYEAHKAFDGRALRSRAITETAGE